MPRYYCHSCKTGFKTPEALTAHWKQQPSHAPGPLFGPVVSTNLKVP